MAQFKVLKDFYLKDQDRIITDRDTITIGDEATIAKLTESGHIEEIKSAEPTQEQLQNDFEQTGADGTQTQPETQQQPGNIEL